MKNTAVVLLFLLALLPLNAQKTIKYITFYPVPYGNHANLTVEKELMINMGTDTESQFYKTEIQGNLSVAKESDIQGFAEIKSDVGSISSTGQIRSGNAVLGAYGTAYSPSNITYLQNTGAAQSISQVSSGNSVFTGSKTILGSTRLDKLAGCSSAQWRNLRLKGSQECKMYLTCGGSGDTGCTTSSLSCKTGYCLEDGLCVRPESTTRTCSSAYSNAVSGTQYRTATCTASGWSYSSWYGNCTCASGYSWNSYSGCTCQPDKVYCQGMAITVAQASTCYHGIWSSDSCSGICCCLDDTPTLVKGVSGKMVPQCKDSTGKFAYACVCQTKGSSGLIVN